MNNDLLKRIDEAHFALLNGMNHEELDVLLRDCHAEIERLRQALAAPVEPVAWMHPDGRVVSGETMNGARKDGGAILSGLKSHNIPLYTTPPSVDALIAEAVAKEREACAQICDPYTHGQWFAKHIRARGQK